MRKLTISLLCTMLLFCTAFSLTASAEGRQYGSIKITYKADDLAFVDMDVSAYKIADVGGFEYFTLAPPFDVYPVSVNNIKTQQEWDDLATTLLGYIQADDIWPDSLFGTDENGVVIMDYIDPGLYLIPGIIVQEGYTVYEFKPFFTYIPQMDSAGNWTYDVEVIPKWSSYIPQTEYSVVKLWKGSGNSANRPKKVEIEIYKNGNLHTTQQLNKGNGWKYTWQTEADGSYWSVVEKNVPKNYKVSVSENDGVFSVVNTYKAPEPDNPSDDTPPADTIPDVGIKVPDTSDTSSAHLYALLMCISGLLLLILGIYRSRRNNEEG